MHHAPDTLPTTITPDTHITFPPPGLSLHPDDAANKSLPIIYRVLLSVGNRAMTIKDMAERSTLCSNVSAATQAITSFLRQHLKRCKEQNTEPLIYKLVLSGNSNDDDLAAALFSLTGGAGPASDKRLRETNFRKGTTVWYLSPASGAPCPFARAGLAVPICDDPMPLVPSVDLSRKRKRRATIVSAGEPEPGPHAQRPKLMLRIKPLQQRQPQPTPSASPFDSDNDNDDDNDSFIYSAFPLSAQPRVRIPPYMPDLDARIYAADEYASDADPPPDSDNEDGDFHNSMLRPPGRDFFDLVADTGSSPESTTSLGVATPEVKQELGPAGVLIKTEAAPIWPGKWGLPGGELVDLTMKLAYPAEMSVIHHHSHQWATFTREPPTVIDVGEFDPVKTTSGGFRFPSVVSSISDATDDIDMLDVHPVKLEPEDLVAKLEESDSSREVSSEPFQNEPSPSLDGEAQITGDVSAETISDDVVEEVTARLAANAQTLECPLIEPVALEDFEADWPGCPSSAPSATATIRACVRRATVAAMPSCFVKPPRPTLITPSFSGADGCTRAARSASLSGHAFAFALRSPLLTPSTTEHALLTPTNGIKRSILHPRKTFTPSLVTTVVGPNAVPVYQTWLDAHRLLRRVDSDYVNVTPLMRFLRIRFDVLDEDVGKRCVLVADVQGASEGIEGLWAPLDVAQRLVRSQPTAFPRPFDFNRLPADIVHGFLCDDICEEFAPALKDMRVPSSSELGVSFGYDEKVIPARSLASDADEPMDLDDSTRSRSFRIAGDKWTWPADIQALPIMPLAKLETAQTVNLVQPRSSSLMDAVDPELTSIAAEASRSAKSPVVVALSRAARSSAQSAARRSIPKRAAAIASVPIVELDDESDLTEPDSDDSEASLSRRRKDDAAPSTSTLSLAMRRRGRPTNQAKATGRATASGRGRRKPVQSYVESDSDDDNDDNDKNSEDEAGPSSPHETSTPELSSPSAPTLRRSTRAMRRPIPV